MDFKNKIKFYLAVATQLASAASMTAFCSISVTASRDYVDRKTELHTSSNLVEQTGYFLGTQTNKVLASKEYVDSVIGDSRSDRITDGTNTIDAAGNVWTTNVIPPWNDGERYWYFDESNNNWTNGTSYLRLSGNYLVVSGFPYGGEHPADIAQGILDPNELSVDLYYLDGMGEGFFGTFTRQYVPGKTSRLALTNDIPQSVTVVAPSTNAASGTAADAKATGTALYTGFTEWEFSGSAYSPSNQYEVRISPNHDFEEYDYIYEVFENGEQFAYDFGTDPNPVELKFDYINCTRHLITPTKTSQLINDGDGTNVFATVNLIDASNETFSNAVLSVGIGIDTNTVAAINALVESGDDLPIGGATSVGAILLAIVAAIAALKRRMTAAETSISGKANTTDLPYALVTPGEWEFSGSGVQGGEYMDEWIDSGTEEWWYQIKRGESGISDTLSFDSRQSIVSFPDVGIVATLLPKGHLLDRAVNAVAVSSATEITLPEKIAGGKSRDFYVRLTVSAESAVTFAATDSGGDAVAWDSMGDPSGTFAAGMYLYRLTEVADGVFHAADITDGGSVDPAVLDDKLDASSAAPAFSDSRTYLVGEYVTYGGVLYRCKTAVTTAGAWTGTSNWEADDMTSPDATLDIMSDGRLRVVTVAGEDLWMQGYDLESTSAQVLKCEKVNLLKFPATTAEAFDSTVAYAVGDSVVYGGMVYKFTAAHSAGAWVGTDAAVDSVSLTMPYVPVGKVGDFVLDVDNSANASVKMTAELSGLFTAFDVFVDKGRNLSDLLTFDGGEQCELYFTMTAFGTQAKPAWKVVKQVVEKQEAGS